MSSDAAPGGAEHYLVDIDRGRDLNGHGFTSAATIENNSCSKRHG
jgi:hypothetical protein